MYVMKKKIYLRTKITAIFGMAILGLTACGPAAEENGGTKDTQVSELTTVASEMTPEVTTEIAPETTTPEATTEIAPETTTPETTTAKQEQPTGYDVNGKVEAAKQESEKLTKQLTEEAVTQADMNQISYQISTLWNETLDYVWLALEDYVDEATWETLSKEQQEWTEKKLEEVALAGSDFEGGSMQVMVECDTDATMTEERVYELLKYFE